MCKILDRLNFKGNHRALSILFFCLASFLGGALNGFIGTGGGIIFVFLLTLMTKNEKKDSYVTTLAAIIPISLVGSISYFNGGSVDFELLKGAYLPAILGGALGAFFVDKLRLKFLNLLFGGLVIYSGITMLVR